MENSVRPHMCAEPIDPNGAPSQRLQLSTHMDVLRICDRNPVNSRSAVQDKRHCNLPRDHDTSYKQTLY